jgi:hypothetical protein
MKNQSSLSQMIWLLLSMCLVACDSSDMATYSQTTETAKISNLAEAEVKAGCAKAINLLNTCAHEGECNNDITMYLPSEPRSHFNALSKQSWFNAEAFKSYCVDVCKSKNTTIDVDAFKFQVCAYADDLSIGH